jgi:hypothetical protein
MLQKYKLCFDASMQQNLLLPILPTPPLRPEGLSSFSFSPQLLQPGLSEGRVEGSCGWHFGHEIDQLKGKLFNDSTRVASLSTVKSALLKYRKMIGYASMAVHAWAALIKMVKLDQPALAKWYTHAHASLS